MFQINNSFISGEVTDEQSQHCLAATNLGMQYIFICDKAIKQAKSVDDKVKLAKVQYRGKN